MVPAPDAPLEHLDLLGQDPVPLLLQEQVLGVLEEDLGPAQLVVGPAAQDLLADLGGELAALGLESSKRNLLFGGK